MIPQTSQTFPVNAICLPCQQRSDLCDGVVPYCTQCVHSNTQSQCFYWSGVNLASPLSGSSSNGVVSPTSSTNTTTGYSSLSSQYYPSGNSHGTAQQPQLPTQTAGGEDFIPDASFLPTLAYFFLPNMHKLLLAVTPTITQFIQGATLGNFVQPTSTFRMHSSLKNAICLWGAHFSASSNPSSVPYVSIFLRQSQRHITRGLQDQEPLHLLEVLQASVLVGLYLLLFGKGSEGTYHVSGAVSLTMGLDLHQLSRPRSGSNTALGACFGPEDLAIRVDIFWNVYFLDKLWSLLADRPPNILDNKDALMRITTPWPRVSKVYQQDDSSVSTVDIGVLLDSPSKEREAPSTLRVKAALLACFALRSSKIWIKRSPSGTPTVTSETQFKALDTRLIKFIDSLPVYANGTASSFECTLASAHLLACVGVVNLHGTVAKGDATSRARCFKAAHLVWGVVTNFERHLGVGTSNSGGVSGGSGSQIQRGDGDIILATSFKIAETALSSLLSLLLNGGGMNGNVNGDAQTQIEGLKRTVSRLKKRVIQKSYGSSSSSR